MTRRPVSKWALLTLAIGIAMVVTAIIWWMNVGIESGYGGTSGGRGASRARGLSALLQGKNLHVFLLVVGGFISVVGTIWALQPRMHPHGDAPAGSTGEADDRIRQ